MPDGERLLSLKMLVGGKERNTQLDSQGAAVAHKRSSYQKKKIEIMEVILQ